MRIKISGVSGGLLIVPVEKGNLYNNYILKFVMCQMQIFIKTTENKEKRIAGYANFMEVLKEGSS